MSGFLDIFSTDEPALRKTLWRGALASLAQSCVNEIEGALDAVSPSMLASVLEHALGAGWLDETGYLEPRSEALALQELAAALAEGTTRAALEERVRRCLERADAGTFAALAARMVQAGDLVPDESDGVRARVTLSLGLPWPLATQVDRLAVAMLARPRAAQAWLGAEASPSLPRRRSAARLLEHGARGVVRLLAMGETWAERLLAHPAVEDAFAALLADREPLVWRHAAVARGLLATSTPSFVLAIDAGLDPALSPTEWRRAATSLGAWLGGSPDAARERLARLLVSDIWRRDGGVLGAVAYGLPAAAETAPAVAVEAFEALFASDPAALAAVLPELLAAGLPSSDTLRARALAELSRPNSEGPMSRALPDDGLEAQRETQRAALESSAGGAADGVEVARLAFVEQGAEAAARLAREAIDETEALVANLMLLDDVDLDDDAADARRHQSTLLDRLHRSLLHDDTLDALLRLDASAAPGLEALTTARDWLATWVLRRWKAHPIDPHAPLVHRGLHLQKLQILLHAADANTDATPGARECRRLIAAAMLEQLAAGVPRALERATLATLARALDALVTAGDLEPIDALLLVARAGLGQGPLLVLREASQRAFGGLLETYLGTFQEALDEPPRLDEISIPPTLMAAGMVELAAPPSLRSFGLAGERLRALHDFAFQLDTGTSVRAATFQAELRRLERSLERLLHASSLADTLSEGDDDGPLAALDQAWDGLLRQLAFAGDRIGLTPSPSPMPLAPAIQLALDRHNGGEALTRLMQAERDAERTLPPVLAALVTPILTSLQALPLQGRVMRPPTARRNPSMQLPPWVPPHRTVGGFAILAPLGAGAAGSVFLARRVEDRDDPSAERFALKVPEYSGSAARTLSEAQFNRLFRAEAAALLHLPEHPNLARFVTFDLAARPKPILVMELVEGPSLDQLPTPDRTRALELLDGVLAGVEAMHREQIGHHDLKPQNVILRAAREPVLVDFGLSGRLLRPGCGSLATGAPEVWLSPADALVSPLPADVYAAAAIAFELLTGEPLFPGDSEVTAVAAHVAHDGWPAPLAARRTQLGPLAELLHDALRRDPVARLTVSTFRARLRTLA